MIRPLQRVVFWSFLALLPAGMAGTAEAQEKVNFHFPMRSGILTPPVPLAECPQGVVVFTLMGEKNNKGEIKGKLILDPNRRRFNEFGEVKDVTERASIELECSLKYLKKKKVNTGPPHIEQERFVYEIQGPKIKSRLLLLRTVEGTHFGQLLIPDKDGEPAYLVVLYTDIPQPCHPGCFPAGTPILTPAGLRPVDTIQTGDLITTVRPDGTTAPRKVEAVSVTRNHLLRVETIAGVLLTTLTQPLCLADGTLRPAGELKEGDMILRWEKDQCRAVKVLKATLTDRQEQVFNLVLGGSEMFVANGFLARSKPPAGTVVSASPELAGPALPVKRE